MKTSNIQNFLIKFSFSPPSFDFYDFPSWKFSGSEKSRMN